MEDKILITAFQNLEKNTNIKGKWETIPPFYIEKGYDVKVKLWLTKNPIYIYGIVKKEIREYQILDILEKVKQNRNFIIIAENIFPKIKERLRKLEIGYLDATGNLFYKDEKYFLFVELQRKLEKVTEINRAFTKAGLKVVYTLLIKPELINATYREIANIADVGLDTINKVFNGLKELNFIIEIDKNNRKLANHKELLERWMVEYNQKLKPALHLGNFRFLNESDYKNWKKIKLKSKDTLWGGEPAADLITNYLKPGEFTIYTNEKKHELMKNYKLVPDNDGDIKIYKKFWEQNLNNQYVPEILVYTDLLYTGNERNLETAKMIYEKFGNNW